MNNKFGEKKKEKKTEMTCVTAGGRFGKGMLSTVVMDSVSFQCYLSNMDQVLRFNGSNSRSSFCFWTRYCCFSSKTGEKQGAHTSHPCGVTIALFGFTDSTTSLY